MNFKDPAGFRSQKFSKILTVDKFISNDCLSTNTAPVFAPIAFSLSLNGLNRHTTVTFPEEACPF